MAIKRELEFHSTVQITHSRDGDDRLHVLVVGHAGLAVGPVLEDQLHDGDGLMGKKVAAAGILGSE